ncbi:MAG: APC family permease [Actinobacteria bacterium]|nr:APC family permease [Actinomycetota bacterium]
MTTASYGDDVSPVSDVRGLRHGAGARLATALAFTSIRPIVGFGGTALLISYAGLSAWQALVALLVVLLLVAVVFGALASRWPIEGGVHGWARQLTGARGGFFTGWLYLCSYVLFMASLAYFDVQRIFFLFGLEPPTVLIASICTAAVLLLATVANTLTRAWIKVIALIAVAASLIGCIGYSVALIAGHSSRGFGDILSSGGSDAGGAWLSGPFLVALAWASAFAFRGFEIPSDISEEMDDAPRVVPRAMLTGLIVGGVLTIIAGISIALVVPAAPEVSDELASNPYAASVGVTVDVAMGSGAAKFLALLLVIATFAAIAVCQLAASRTIWTMARDRELPGSSWLVQLSPRRRLPRNAIIVAGVIGVILPFLIFEIKTAYVLQGASATPLLIAFLIPLVGLLRSRIRSSWESGPFGLGRWMTPVAVIAALALLGLALNALWPREQLYGSGRGLWGPSAITVVIVILGLGVMAWAYRDGGVHVRHHGHVERDLNERVRLGHAGTCVSCHRDLAAGDEAFWNPEAHVVICVACEEVVVE